MKDLILLSTRKKNDFLELDIVQSIRIQIEEISTILLEDSQEYSEKELRDKMYQVTARIIALAAWREEKKSPIHQLLARKKQPDSLLTRITTQEINALQHLSAAPKDNH
ncbi:MAG: hypothetical protein EU981_03665 [Candidatus Liberibacter ctenarytainae]|uniref:Uncharacterized protein n=1 Tax=Candidatus Liberibacter ctenarytainae TaxID=2020335 RepID=A0A937AFJ9_9HYPH|nr:hypothetical protein [Candidatus Liberibacter ctenarytainae]